MTDRSICFRTNDAVRKDRTVKFLRKPEKMSSFKILSVKWSMVSLWTLMDAFHCVLTNKTGPGPLE